MSIDTFTTYRDEFGEIDADVLREAQKIRHYSRSLALKMLNDEQKGQILMMQAAAKVTKKLSDRKTVIDNLSSYLSTTFRHLVFAEAKKELRHAEIEKKHFESLSELFENGANSEEEKICRRILIKEIEGKMDDWTRKVTQYRELGYEFKDLVPFFGKAENVIRAKYSKKLRDLAAEIQAK